MGSLFGSLNASLTALRSFEQALEVSQNNVSNVSTPGYARQVATLQALRFSLGSGLLGGVENGPTLSTQNEYANQAVRTQLSLQGKSGAQTNPLAAIESLFDASGQSGVIGALNQLFQSFSAWSSAPSSTSAQQDVLAKAQAVAQSFQSTASSLTHTTADLDQQIRSTVQQINNIASDIRNYNAEIAKHLSSDPDPGLDARLHASLESLSKLVDTTARFESNGTVTVLIGGQTLLVIGTTQYSIQANFTDPPAGPNANAIPDAHIHNEDGDDITNQFLQGSLGGLLEVRNQVLPGLQGNGSQQGTLNQLAKQVADRVNAILTAAQTAGGQAGIPLFAYNPASPVDVAATLTLNPNITIGTLAPVEPGTPPVSNGAALALSNLGNSTAAADQIAGQTILEFLNGMAARVGQQASDAQDGQGLHTQLLAQAHAFQDQVSGVSLDAEAIQVLELQRGYQAASKMVSVVDTLTQTLINMV
jgi:flagellar hook-associated protein 1 FlgK